MEESKEGGGASSHLSSASQRHFAHGLDAIYVIIQSTRHEVNLGSLIRQVERRREAREKEREKASQQDAEGFKPEEQTRDERLCDEFTDDTKLSLSDMSKRLEVLGRNPRLIYVFMAKSKD